MAVHVPLSLEAQLEARVLMMSTNNILHPANGQPIIVPSQDIVLGLYYVSLMRDGDIGQGMAFANIGEIEHALQAKAVTLHSRIKGGRGPSMARASACRRIFETTPGRMILGQLLPHHVKIPFDVVNKLMTKKEISEHDRYRLPQLRSEGDGHLLRPDHGRSAFARRSRPVFPSVRTTWSFRKPKPRIIAETSALAKEYEQQYNDGLITQGEKI